MQTPHPPIWIPSQGSGETIEWAAAPERKYPVIMAFSPTDAVIKFHGSYRQQAEKFGYEISGDQLGWSTPTYVAETDEIAERESAEHLEALFNNFFHIPPELLFPPGYTSIRSLQAMLESRKGLAAARVTFNDLMTRGNVIVGSAGDGSRKDRSDPRQDRLSDHGADDAVRHPAGRARQEEHADVRRRGRAEASSVVRRHAIRGLDAIAAYHPAGAADERGDPRIRHARACASGPDKAFRFAVDMIRRGEELGFETTLLAERWMGTDHSAWLLAAALAPLTSRIELMVAVHPGIITPQAVAKLAVSLDRISGGRAAINIVNGWWKEEFETFGHGWQPQDDDARYRRMDEFVRVLRGLWQQDVFDFHGEFYTVDRQGLPLKSVQLPHPPIYAGTRNETGKEVIARDGDYLVRRLPDRLPDVGAEHRAGRGLHRRHEKRARRATAARSISACRVMSSAPIRQTRAIELANQLEEHGKTEPHRLHRRQGARPGPRRHARADRRSHPPL